MGWGDLLSIFLSSILGYFVDVDQLLPEHKILEFIQVNFMFIFVEV